MKSSGKVEDDEEVLGTMKVLNKPETYIHALYDNENSYHVTEILTQIKPR